MAQIDGEEVVFSCKVEKLNRFGFNQTRIILVTNNSVCNVKDNDIQRKINVNAIHGVTKSTKPGNFEFVIHVRSEYDYVFSSEMRSEIIDSLKFVFWQKTKTNLPIYGVCEKDLEDFS